MASTAEYSSLSVGSQIDEYRLVSVLGQGSFGITYLAEDTNLGSRLALKEYFPADWAVRDATATVRPKNASLGKTFEQGMEAFLREARLLAAVSHANIVKVRRFFRHHGTAYIAMDFVDGRSLADTLDQDYPSGGYPPASLARLTNAVLQGLRALHQAGIIHRDIKPGNILIERDGNPVLVDLGAARIYQRSLSRAMTVVMTPGYAPIEQYSEDAAQGPFTDLYAMGAMLYRAITGRPPEEPYRRLGRDAMVAASVAGAGRYPSPLLAAIDWALAVQPEDRPQSAAALLDALRVGADGAEPTIRRADPVRQGSPVQETAPRIPVLAADPDSRSPASVRGPHASGSRRRKAPGDGATGPVGRERGKTRARWIAVFLFAPVFLVLTGFAVWYLALPACCAAPPSPAPVIEPESQASGPAPAPAESGMAESESPAAAPPAPEAIATPEAAVRTSEPAKKLPPPHAVTAAGRANRMPPGQEAEVGRGIDRRCAAIMETNQLGEVLSNEDHAYLRDNCR